MPKHQDPSRRLLKFARTMRREQTDAERKLWRLVRDRRLGGFKFRRQVPIEDFIVDFYCHDRRLVVEADGGQHYDKEAIDYDRQRTLKLQRIGIRVLRFTDVEVLKYPDAVAKTILRVLHAEDSGPHPDPLPGR